MIIKPVVKIESNGRRILLDKMPNWIMRTGIMIYSGVFLVLIMGALFFPYPETMKGHVKIVEQVTSGQVGVLTLPVSNSGALTKGQQVNIKLYNYPYQEYGMLVGRIDTICFNSSSDLYEAWVRLPENLLTSYGKKLPFMPGLSGVGEVMIKESNLFERVFPFVNECRKE